MTNSNIIPLPVTAAKAEPQKLDLDQYAAELAAALGWHVVDNGAGWGGPPWISQEPVTSANSKRVPTLVIRQETWTKAKKIVISATWPSSDATSGVCAPDGGDAKIESRVDPRRPMVSIASDLRKRTLPMYLARYATCMAKIAEWEAYKADGDGVAQRIQAALGIRSLDQRGEVRKSFYAHDEDCAAGAHVQVSGESVALQITGLTEAQALRIIEIVRGG